MNASPRQRQEDPNQNLVKMLYKLSFESLILNSMFLEINFLLNLRKLLKVSYLLDNLSGLT